MRASVQRSKSRLLWFAVLLLILAGAFGGYAWYQHATIKYDRITNARSV